jgi:hypothetical protein
MLGDNLSSYQNLDFITGSSPDELKLILSQIKVPFTIIAIYSQSGNHVAWINPSQKLIKKTKKGK